MPLGRELILPATRVELPTRPSASSLHDIEEILRDDWTTSAAEWAETAVFRLAIAAVLESSVLNTRLARLQLFDLQQDPSKVTMAELAALFRPHNGSAGQAFELAVIDAVNARVPSVLDPIREALRLLGVEAHSIEMVALGLEKTRSGGEREFWELVAARVPADAVLRSGMRGKPMSAATVFERLAASSWRSMTTPAGSDPEMYRRSASQLGRADALLACDRWLVPVSFKVRHTDVRFAWRHVPVWVTHWNRPTEVRMSRLGEEGVPLVSVNLRSSGWVSVFLQAVATVYAAMDSIDRQRPAASMTRYPPRSRTAVERLRRNADQPVATVCNALRRVDAHAIELYDELTAASEVRTPAAVVDDSRIADLWTPSRGSAPLIVGERHLFLADPAHP
jgi:hypothetical protein